MLTVITLPGTAVTDLTGYIGNLVTDSWVLIALVVGIPLGFYVIRRIVALIPKGR
jgi:hypothetical protein